MTAIRERLPDRRPMITGKLPAFGRTLFVSAGFDPMTGRVGEVFFAGTKEGSTMDTLLSDVAVVLSVALQHGVPAEALAHSIARVPAAPVAPKDLDGGNAPPTVPASPIGAALDWLIAIEGGTR